MLDLNSFNVSKLKTPIVFTLWIPQLTACNVLCVDLIKSWFRLSTYCKLWSMIEDQVIPSFFVGSKLTNYQRISTTFFYLYFSVVLNTEQSEVARIEIGRLQVRVVLEKPDISISSLQAFVINIITFMRVNCVSVFVVEIRKLHYQVKPERKPSIFIF